MGLILYYLNPELNIFKSQVNLDFEFLDDMYTVTQWLHKGQELVYENIKTREIDPNTNHEVDFRGTKEDLMEVPLTMNTRFTIPEDPGSYEAFNDLGRLNGSAVTYTEDTNVLRHNHPLMIMVSGLPFLRFLLLSNRTGSVYSHRCQQKGKLCCNTQS